MTKQKTRILLLDTTHSGTNTQTNTQPIQTSNWKDSSNTNQYQLVQENKHPVVWQAASCIQDNDIRNLSNFRIWYLDIYWNARSIRPKSKGLEIQTSSTLETITNILCNLKRYEEIQIHYQLICRKATRPVLVHFLRNTTQHTLRKVRANILIPGDFDPHRTSIGFKLFLRKSARSIGATHPLWFFNTKRAGNVLNEKG